MVTLLLDTSQLEVVLSPLEQAAAFYRDNLRVDRDHITKVQLTEEPWTWLRGVASPGTHIKGLFAAGTWETATSRDFVLVRRRRPAVVIDLEGSDYARLLLGTRHGLALAQALRLDVSAEPTDVTEIAATGAIPVTPDAGGPSRNRGKAKPTLKPA
ncbi:hypothetical protein [Microbacterium sp. YY-01]|uniref:hypothetical protein n=1 Tax=Microbacterium sp. YY-01 TaxID=3421634 RepID=UPI003D164BC8